MIVENQQTKLLDKNTTKVESRWKIILKGYAFWDCLCTPPSVNSLKSVMLYFHLKQTLKLSFVIYGVVFCLYAWVIIWYCMWMVCTNKQDRRINDNQELSQSLLKSRNGFVWQLQWRLNSFFAYKCFDRKFEVRTVRNDELKKFVISYTI